MRLFIRSLFLYLLILFSYNVCAETVNINKASADALMYSIKGIGEAKARAIVDYREKNGPFKSIEDLSYVKGIGMATVEKNRDALTVE